MKTILKGMIAAFALAADVPQIVLWLPQMMDMGR